MAAMKAVAPASVDAYLAGINPAFRPALEKIRTAVRSAAPQAKELISYQMPAFWQEGPVAYFAAFKNHCSYFTASHELMKQFKAELAPFKTSGVTIHFTPAKPLPAALVKKLVKAKLAENLARAAAKAAKKAALKKTAASEKSNKKT